MESKSQIYCTCNWNKLWKRENIIELHLSCDKNIATKKDVLSNNLAAFPIVLWAKNNFARNNYYLSTIAQYVKKSKNQLQTIMAPDGGSGLDVDDKINWERRRERKLKKECTGCVSCVSLDRERTSDISNVAPNLELKLASNRNNAIKIFHHLSMKEN